MKKNSMRRIVLVGVWASSLAVMGCRTETLSQFYDAALAGAATAIEDAVFNFVSGLFPLEG